MIPLPKKINSKNKNKSIIKEPIEEEKDKISLSEVITKILEYLEPGLKYILMGGLCIFIGSVLLYITTTNTSSTKKNPVEDKPPIGKNKKNIGEIKIGETRAYVYIMTILLPMLLLLYLFIRKESSQFDSSTVMTVGGIIVFITITVLLSYLHKPGSSSTSSIVMQSYIINLIIIAIFIVGLAIGYNVLKNSAKKMRGWPGFIVNFIFFIPCLLSDFVDYMVSEFKSSPPSVYILFLIEIILILAYIYVPKILKMLIFKNGLTLQHKPVYLNKVKILSNSDIFLLPNSVTSTAYSDISSNDYNSNFGLSMWIYVNNMGTSKLQESGTMLFQNSSPNNVNGKPSIQFMGGNDEWKFTFTDELIKYNILSSENPSYLQLTLSGDFVEPLRPHYSYKHPDNDLYTISETLNFLKDAGKGYMFYSIDDAQTDVQYVTSSDSNPNNYPKTLYKEWLDIETTLKDTYIITYTYSYGINDFSGKVTHSNKDTFNSIKDVLKSILKDYADYSPTANQRVYEAIQSKIITEADAEYFMPMDMFNLVTKITQTVKYNGENSFRLTIPSQKWNHIVFNYYQNTVDLFINGNLERSMNLKNSPIHMLPTDIISIGDVNGINGAICNIVYYTEPLTKTKISHIYNTNFMKNPPI